MWPLSNAKLPATLKGTAKDLWKAVRTSITSWVQFKAVFVKSFVGRLRLKGKNALRIIYKGQQNLLEILYTIIEHFVYIGSPI